MQFIVILCLSVYATEFHAEFCDHLDKLHRYNHLRADWEWLICVRREPRLATSFSKEKPFVVVLDVSEFTLASRLYLDHPQPLLIGLLVHETLEKCPVSWSIATIGGFNP